MTGPLVWVVGRGLLGRRLEDLAPRAIPGAVCWGPATARLSWGEPGRLALELGDAARAFGEEARRREAPWMALWCAAAGGVDASSETLGRETEALRQLLGALGTALGRTPHRASGTLLFCSSAGGVYGRGPELPLTEDSPCQPISAYGRSKLGQETEVLRWAGATPGVSCLVARLSNLYGSGQNLERSPGLIARLSQSLLHRRPRHVYVPLDTLRDYLHAGDAARYILGCLDRLWRSDRPASLVKIIASEQSISIAGVIGIFTRVAKRAPRIICMPDPLSRQQPSRLRFRSRVWTDQAPRMMDLAAGIREVYQDHLSLFQRGRLPVPPER
ncbi:MAG TPA: NAD-dependent epimerase/dehydratase family protein [Methylomirabilota bacterium]